MATKVVPFEEWMPDRASLETGLIRAQNVIPTLESYETAPGFSTSIAFPTIPATPLLVRGFTTSTGEIITLAFCAADIYQYAGTSWRRVTRQNLVPAFVPYNTGATNYWSVVQWGDFVYATNYADPIQKFDLNGVGVFTNVQGTVAGHRAKINVIIGDFHVTFSTNDATGSSAAPFRMHQSGRLRPEDFDPALATQAGFRDIVNIGRLVAAVGGEYGLILGETGMARVDYIGPPLVWQIRDLDLDVGCLYRKSVLKVGGRTMWYSPKGWRQSTGGPSEAIGQGKVDTYFRKRVDPRSADGMSNVVLPDRPVAMFSYISVDSPDGLPDEVLFYHYEAGRFSEGSYRFRVLGTVGPSPIFLDDVTLGELFVDDSDELVDAEGDDRPTVACISPDNKVQTIDPSIDNSLIVSREMQFIAGKRARVLRVRLIAEGDQTDHQVRVSTRDKQPPTDVQNDPWLTPERTGSCAANRRGLYHRFSVRLLGKFSSILGVEITYRPAGDK